jgi:hypothetical protein
MRLPPAREESARPSAVITALTSRWVYQDADEAEASGHANSTEPLIELLAPGADHTEQPTHFVESIESEALPMNSDDLIMIAMLAGSPVLAGSITYALTGRDLKGLGRVAAALVSAFLVGATSLFVPWLPLLAFLASMTGYLVMRRLLKPGLALAASAVVLFGSLSFAVVLMVATLNSM